MLLLIKNADVAKLKQELGDYDKIRGQREELLKQRKTIQSLEAGRTGPVYLLRELSEILSPGKRGRGGRRNRLLAQSHGLRTLVGK